MHEQLRAFGRRESIQLGERLCDTQIALDLLDCTFGDQQEKKTKVETIKLDSSPKGQRFDIGRLVEFPNLRVLWLHDIHLMGVSEKNPSTFRNMNQLHYVVIEEFKLGELPKRFGSVHGLELLALRNSHGWKLGRLISLFVSMSSLEVLEIDRCDRLAELPRTAGRLSALRNLKISNCHGLKSFPTSFLDLFSLESMKLWNLTELTHVPEEIGRLKRLRRMELVNCHNLKDYRPLSQI